MQPDFSKPAFSFVPLCKVRFNLAVEGGHSGPFRSDYRCQLRYIGDQRDHEVVPGQFLIIHRVVPVRNNIIHRTELNWSAKQC